jgi:DNA repair protein RadA/Sms
MAKPKSIYSCTECGGQTLKWQGQCPHCQAWNTLVEAVVEQGARAGTNRFASLGGTSEVVSLADVQADDFPRLPTLIDEFDRVLGGGLVEGGVVLIGGDPGIGKSTLLLQAAARLAEQGSVLYVSGEESAQQVALRAKRLGVNASKVRLLPEIELEKIQSTLASQKPRVAIIDSIQTLYSSALRPPGFRRASARVRGAAHAARETKRHRDHLHRPRHEGRRARRPARPRAHGRYRPLLRGRHAHELPPHPRLQEPLRRRERDRRLRDDREGAAGGDEPIRTLPRAAPVGRRGSCVMVTQEGTRPLLVELQALVDSAQGMGPRRLTVGLERDRLAMLLAVSTVTPGSPASTRTSS